MDKANVRAKVQTPTGMTVEITGSKDEVQGLLASLISGKQKQARSQTKRRSAKFANKREFKPILSQLASEGFFKGKERTLTEIITRVNARGFNVRGRRVGGLANALTLACRDPEIKLQRRKLKKAERKGKEKWVFFGT